MSKILVTGGYGLVGSEFVGDKYVRFSSKELDLTKSDQIDKVLSENNLDGIIHCAAKVGGIKGNMDHQGEYFYKNIIINTNIIECARKHNIQNFVGLLSTCIFPDNVEYPLKENKIHSGEPHYSNYAYAYAKRMMEVQIRAYRDQYGLKYKSVIPTNIYGPNDNYNLDNGHVVASLIHKCYLARENKTPFVIWGTGKPLREFIFSKDVAKLINWVLHNYEENEPIILSNSQEISIKELSEIIIELMNFKGQVVWEKSKPEGQYKKPSDNSKIVRYLPNFTFTNIYDGLKQTIEHFEVNYKILRK